MNTILTDSDVKRLYKEQHEKCVARVLKDRKEYLKSQAFANNFWKMDGRQPPFMGLMVTDLILQLIFSIVGALIVGTDCTYLNPSWAFLAIPAAPTSLIMFTRILYFYDHCHEIPRPATNGLLSFVASQLCKRGHVNIKYPLPDSIKGEINPLSMDVAETVMVNMVDEVKSQVNGFVSKIDSQLTKLRDAHSDMSRLEGKCRAHLSLQINSKSPTKEIYERQREQATKFCKQVEPLIAELEEQRTSARKFFGGLEAYTSQFRMAFEIEREQIAIKRASQIIEESEVMLEQNKFILSDIYNECLKCQSSIKSLESDNTAKQRASLEILELQPQVVVDG